MATDYSFEPAEGTDATSNGERALREAIDENGEQLAAVLERTDQFGDLLETAVLVIASAEDDEVEHVTESLVNLVDAADSLSSDEAALLVDALEEDGEEMAEALGAVLELQREDQLEDLIELAGTLSALEVDDDAAGGLNRLLGAVSDAEQEAEPVGPVGFARGLLDRDVRSGLGYLLAVLRSLG